MFINEQSLIGFTELIMNLPLFANLDKRDELKELVKGVLLELYRDNPKYIEEIFTRTFSINPISYVFALSMGVMDKDVVLAIQYFLRDMIKLLIEKGDINNVKYLQELLISFGVTTKIYLIKVEDTNQYIGVELFTGLKRNFTVHDPEMEFITDIHRIHLSKYAEELRELEYTTVVIYLDISNIVVFDHDTYSPPNAMIAYAFTRYRDESIQFTYTDNGRTFTTSMLNFMKLFRYLYLKSVQMDNPGFDIGYDQNEQDAIDNDPNLKVMWYMLHDTTNLDELYDLCDMYIHRIKTRADLDLYIRSEALLLDNYTKVINGDNRISDIYNDLHSNTPEIIDYIDQNATTSEIIMNYLMQMRRDLVIKTYSMTFANDVDRESFLVFLYLVNLIVFDVDQLRKHIVDIVYTFKKYFLPIYTTFEYNVEYIWAVKNRLMKLYVDDDSRNKQIMTAFVNLINPLDDQTSKSYIDQEDWVLLEDSGHAQTIPRPVDLLELNDRITAAWALDKKVSVMEFFDDHNSITQPNINDSIITDDNYESRQMYRNLNEFIDILAKEYIMLSNEVREQLLASDNIKTKLLSNPSDQISIDDDWSFTIYDENGQEIETVTKN